MTEVNKLNLSAMMHHTDKNNMSDERNENENETNVGIHNDGVENKNIKTGGIKINLSSIKSDKKPEEIKEVIEKPAEIKDAQTLYFESLTSRVIEKPLVLQEQTKNEKKLKISALKSPINKVEEKQDSQINQKQGAKLKISSLRQPILSCKIEDKEKYIQKTAEKNTDTIEESENNSGEVFHNYESEFKKKETSILDSIAKIKAVAQLKKLSKTNKIFLASIIGVTVVGLGFIFHIDPDTHSLDNYKASILTLAGKEMTKQEVIDLQGEIENEIAWQLEENNLGGYNLGFEILVNKNGQAVYKFDGREFESKEFLDLAIAQKLEILKKEKILDYFKQQNNQSTTGVSGSTNNNIEDESFEESNNMGVSNNTEETIKEEYDENAIFENNGDEFENQSEDNLGL